MALPDDEEERDPAFQHVEKKDLPVLEAEGKKVRLILGTLYGEKAPVRVFNEMFYADAVLETGSVLPLPTDHEDRGVYVIDGAVEVAGDRYEAGRMLVFRPGDPIGIRALEPSRLMLLGGETMGGPRHIWWNFVASSQEKIDAAKAAWAAGDWQSGRFRLPQTDDGEFIPLPEK